ncbi:hypothetical protein Pcinc_011812 [Petrolisthes cinctipes]|uniref:Uncharacterized protein n=1 Tax=Petrolisthes cinctipes TaxID=88211 RepID=A0AAE1G1Y6_PETCI|nr:hypothetical protein Pcinc_011812 [Petrolisthes cinctipes]
MTLCGEVDLLDALIDAGANPTTPDIHGAYPLHYAAQMCGPNSEMGNDVRVGMMVLRKLLQRGVDVTVTDHDGRQPLLWAASAGSADAILALINAGASVSAYDKDGLTALHCAASRGHLDCLDSLLNFCGAEVDTLDSNGCTPLFYSVTLGHADCTYLLLHHGSDPDKQDRKGRTPAHCGAAKGQIETLKLLHQNEADLWKKNVKGDLPLHEACQSGRRDLVLWLLSMRPETVNAPNLDGRCPLHIAAINSNVEMCKILMDNQAAVNPIMRNSRGQLLTPLDAAVARSNRNCAKYLALHGGITAAKLTDKHALQAAMQKALESGHSSTEMAGDELHSSSASSILKSNISTMTASPINMEAQTDTGDLQGKDGDETVAGEGTESEQDKEKIEQRDAQTGTSEINIRKLVLEEEAEEEAKRREEEKMRRQMEEGRIEEEGEVEEEDNGARSERVGEEEENRERKALSKRGSKTEDGEVEENIEREGEVTVESGREDENIAEEGEGVGEEVGTKEEDEEVGTREEDEEVVEREEEVVEREQEEEAEGMRASVRNEEAQLEGRASEKRRRRRRRRKRGGEEEEEEEEEEREGEGHMEEKEEREGEEGHMEDEDEEEEEYLEEEEEEEADSREVHEGREEEEEDLPNKEIGERRKSSRKSVHVKEGSDQEVFVGDTDMEDRQQQSEEEGQNGGSGGVMRQKRETSKKKNKKKKGKSEDRLSGKDGTSDSRKKGRKSRQGDSRRGDENGEVIISGNERECGRAGSTQEDEFSGEGEEKDQRRGRSRTKHGRSRKYKDKISGKNNYDNDNREVEDDRDDNGNGSDVDMSGEDEDDDDDDGEEVEEDEERVGDVDVERVGQVGETRHRISASRSRPKSAAGRGSNKRASRAGGRRSKVHRTGKGKGRHGRDREEDDNREGVDEQLYEPQHLETNGRDYLSVANVGGSQRLPSPSMTHGRDTGDSGFKVQSPLTHNIPAAGGPGPSWMQFILSHIIQSSIASCPACCVKAEMHVMCLRCLHPIVTESGYSDTLVAGQESDEPTDTERHTDDDEAAATVPRTRRKTKTKGRRTRGREERVETMGENGDDYSDAQDGVHIKGGVRTHRRKGRRSGRKGNDPQNEDGEDDDDEEEMDEEEDEEGDADALRKLGVATHRRPGVRRGQIKSGAMSGGPLKVESMESNLKRRGNRKAASPSTEISITQAMQNTMRKYALERRLFQQLLDLKRQQIRNTRANEHVLIKRMVDAYQKEGVLLGLRGYAGPFSFNSYEKYLYDQLRILQTTQGVKIPSFRPTDDVEKLSKAIRRAELREVPDPFMSTRDAHTCNHTTHRCHHAAHAYTGVPCAAYIGYRRRKQNPNNINNNNSSNNNKQVSLPKIPGAGNNGSILRDSPGHPRRARQNNPIGLRNYDPKNPLTVELQHGKARQQIVLPTDLLDKSKKYHLTFTIKPSSPLKQEPSQEKDTASPERSASAPESLPSDQVPPSDPTLAPEGPHKDIHSAPIEGRIEA